MRQRLGKPSIRTVIAAVLLFQAAGNAVAAGCLPRVRDGWIRLAPTGMSMPMLAGYGRIENPCPGPAVITGASSPAFADVSLHGTSVVDGISRMRAVPTLPIAANATATLEPGGLHLMLMQPNASLKPGDTITIMLKLDDGRAIRGSFVARPMQ